MFAGQGMTIGNPFQQVAGINPLQAAALAARCAICGTPAAVSGLYQQYVSNPNPLSIGSTLGMANPALQTGGSGINPFTSFGMGISPGIHPAIAAGLLSVNPSLTAPVGVAQGHIGSGVGTPWTTQQQWPQQAGFPLGAQAGGNPGIDPHLATLIALQQNPFAQVPIRPLPGVQPGNPFLAQQGIPFGIQQGNPFGIQQGNPFGIQQAVPLGVQQGSPLGVQHSSPFFGQQTNPLFSQGPNPFHTGLIGNIGGIGSPAIDPYTMLAQAQLASQFAQNPFLQVLRAYVANPWLAAATSPLSHTGLPYGV